MVFKKENHTVYTPQQIIISVAGALWMLPEDVTKKTRVRHIVDARYIAIAFVNKYCDLSQKAIGKVFSCDRATVKYALDTVPDLIDSNRAFYAKYSLALTKLESQAV